MLTIKLICILLVALVALGVVALLLDSSIAIDDCSSAPRLSTRAYRVVTGCSYIVKFGMVLTAVALVGCIAPAGLGLAMAFAIPKPTSVPKGSWFDHSHNVATTIPFGAVVPVDWRFMMPGEKYKTNISGFCRALMLKAPAMQDVDLKYATYFVPTRLLCDKNEEIISEVSTPQLNASDGILSDVINPSSGNGSFPYFAFNAQRYNTILSSILTFKKSSAAGYGFDFDAYSKALNNKPLVYNPENENYKKWLAADVIRRYSVGSLFDYLGFPVVTDSQLDSLCKTYSDGSVSGANFNIKSVPISLLPFKAYHAICNHFFIPDFQRRQAVGSNVLTDIRSSENGLINNVQSSLMYLRYSQYESDPYTCARNSSAVTRVGGASATSPNEQDTMINANTIRGMFALDEYARKIEYFFGDLRKQIKYMFGVVVSDKSALSPILVNAGSCPIGVSEVQNTSLDPVNVEQNSQSLGKMTAGFGKNYDTFEVEEHGVMMTCVWIRPRTSYMNKLPFMFRQFIDASSIPNPLFSEIGEVSLSAYDVDYDPFRWMDTPKSKIVDRSNDLFGYNSRYVEWKYTLDTFSGDFRSSLAYWHCAREFDEDSVAVDSSQLQDTYLSAGADFNLINGRYSLGSQPLNRIFTQVKGIPDVRPFQLQLRFNTQIWQLYPHIDDEL